MILEANLALIFFLTGNVVCPLVGIQTWFILVSVSVVCTVISMNLFEADKDYIKVIFISSGLGLVFSKSLCYTILYLSSHDYILMQFSLYVSVMACFHYSEYLAVSLCNPGDLRINAFLLTHSKEYGMALCIAVIEMALESYFFPFLKGNIYMIAFGLFMTLSGEFVRKLAMYTAGVSFTHMVSTWKERDHVLVTSGIYSWCRHPSYVGWSLWSIGTQVLLCNPLCILAYTCAVKIFYQERIRTEEFHLIRFFGRSYMDYQKRVPTGLPFIKGFILEVRN